MISGFLAVTVSAVSLAARVNAESHLEGLTMCMATMRLGEDLALTGPWDRVAADPQRLVLTVMLRTALAIVLGFGQGASSPLMISPTTRFWSVSLRCLRSSSGAADSTGNP